MLRNARINGNKPFLVCFCSFAPYKPCPFCPATAFVERGTKWPVVDSWIGRRDETGKGCDCERCIGLEFDACIGGPKKDGKPTPFGTLTNMEDGDDTVLPEGTTWSADTFDRLPKAAKTVDSCIDHLMMRLVAQCRDEHGLRAFEAKMAGEGDPYSSFGGFTAATVMKTIERHYGPAWMAL